LVTRSAFAAKELKWCINYLKEKNGINSFVNLDDESAFRAFQNITIVLK